VNSPHPGYRAPASPLRRASQIALLVGAGLAVAAAFGPLWIVRAGIALAIIAGFVAVRYAWQEQRQTREEAGRTSLRQLREHSTLLSTERRRNSEVVSVLRQHNDSATERLAEREMTIGQLSSELSSLRGSNAVLRSELVESDQRITQLRASLAEHVAELQQHTPEGEANVIAISRHAVVTDWDALPSAEDLWATGNHPAVVDLQNLADPTLFEQKRLQA
jgi:hypothetical protein